jgi:hypothetical protein
MLAYRSVMLQLRVPEMRYAVGDHAQKETAEAVEGWIQEGITVPREADRESIVKAIETAFALTPLPSVVNNSAFFTDRIFDVWQRKNQLADELNHALSIWRFPVFVLLFRGQLERQLGPLLQALETLSLTQLGWTPPNSHHRSLLLEHLEMLALTVRQRLLEGVDLQDLPALNDSFVQQQELKRSKVVARLRASEQLLARQRHARWQAIELINRRFADSELPDSVLCFLARHWLPALAQACARQDEELLATFKRHQDQLYAVFGKRGQWVFKYSGDLIEVLSQATNEVGLPEPVPPEVWQGIEQDLISLLQKQELELELYPYTPVVFVDAEVDQFVDGYALRHPTAEGDWLLLTESGLQRRVRVELLDAPSQQVLLADALGVKVRVLACSELDALLDRSELRPLKSGSTIGQVFESALSGLYKIADAQSKARIKAAEKAKQEAERLLEEQRQAQLDAQERANEIARKTRELQLRRAEKQRLDQIREVTDVLAGFNVGGWIDMLVGEERQRFKLAVKLAVSGKYIFVDRLGIKRLEFNEGMLVDRILSGEITILSGGVEFENSLERVVSRLRIQK